MWVGLTWQLSDRQVGQELARLAADRHLELAVGLAVAGGDAGEQDVGADAWGGAQMGA